MDLATLHGDALLWTTLLEDPYAIAWIPVDREGDTRPLEDVARQLLPDEPSIVRRNVLGKPEVICENESSSVHVSNTHDGGTHLAVGVRSELISDVGVDMVYLPRIRTRQPDYFRRLISKVANPGECSRFEEMPGSRDQDDICLRFAAHFSIKEAVSKAHGVGLKLGFGFGSPLSLNPREIEVHNIEPASLQKGMAYTALVITPRQGKITAYFAASEEYLISIALLSET